ncbi:MAG: hypothetical protein KAJ73_05480 [Zetaproteobacteria bacterium]|nr:hypothetical protein [Zetaproteobacteria bacterium]
MTEPTVVTPTVDPTTVAPQPDPTVTAPTEPTKPDPSVQPSGDPEGYVKTERLTGAIQKIQTLTEEAKLRDLEQAALSQKITALEVDLGVKDLEVKTAVGERDTQVEAEKLSKAEAEKKLVDAEQTLRKIEIAKKLKHPELIEIIDTIPNFENDELQEKAMQDIVDFSDIRVKQREEQLLSGVTPSITSTDDNTPADPASNDGWKAKIAGESDAAKRSAMYDDWYKWQQANPESLQG